MANRQHIIELNGKRYDAITGKQLSSDVSKPIKKKTSSSTISDPSKHLDGFSRRTRTHTVVAGAKKIHKATDKSHTLMRTAVKRPATKKIHAKAVASSSVEHYSLSNVNAKISNRIKPERILRASTIAQNNLISKFGRPTSTIKTAALPVKAEPKRTHITHTRLADNSHDQPSKIQAESFNDPFQQALEKASTFVPLKAVKTTRRHKLAHRLNVSPKVLNAAGIVVVSLAIGGFFAYQNIPEITMKFAAARAGLNASIPAYHPSGFSLAGPVEYHPGQVILNYKSNSDERVFNVTQKASSWNSETLLENFISVANKQYQTVQANGRTIFIYDGNKATWVDGGIWYSIEGKADLNSDQLLRIATSL